MTNTRRYLAGLCVTALGLCAGGWLVLTPFAFGYPGHGRAAVTALATGGGLAVVCGAALACWAMLWRRRLRTDGVLASKQSRRSRRSVKRHERAERLIAAARQRELETAPDPAQVLTDLRALLTPLLADTGVKLVPSPASEEPAAEEPAPEEPAVEGPVVAEPAVAEPAVVEPVPVPGHLRSARSAAFFTPRQAGSPEQLAALDEAPPVDALLRGAELLMVGTGEEEAW